MYVRVHFLPDESVQLQLFSLDLFQIHLPAEVKSGKQGRGNEGKKKVEEKIQHSMTSTNKQTTNVAAMAFENH